MPKTIHTVVTPDGQTHTRTSASRVYSHVVIGRRSLSFELGQADQTWDGDRRNFDYDRAIAALQPGEPLTHRGFTFQRGFTAEEIAKSQARIAGHAGRDAYAEAKRQERVAAIRQREAEGYYAKWHAITWSSRLDLALRAMGSTDCIGYEDRQAVETTIRTK